MSTRMFEPYTYKKSGVMEMKSFKMGIIVWLLQGSLETWWMVIMILKVLQSL